MNWITLEEFLLIHERVTEETGGIRGIINFSGLESSLSRPFTSFSGDDMFPDLYSKVASLIHSLISSHPFTDGNKRTALVSADVCLRLNGIRLIPSSEIESFFWNVARGQVNLDEIIRWLKLHTENWDK